MKKVFSILVLLFLPLTFVGCKKEEVTVNIQEDGENLLIDKKGVKIFYSGVHDTKTDMFFLILDVENDREKDIYVMLHEIYIDDIAVTGILSEIAKQGKRTDLWILMDSNAIREKGIDLEAISSFKIKLKVTQLNYWPIFSTGIIKINL